MPIVNQFEIGKNVEVFVWQLTETRAELERVFVWESTDTSEFATISHPLKQTEWLASRLLLKIVCVQKKLDYLSITKDSHGKPHFINSHVGVSLTHTSAFAAVAVNTRGSVGIDLETMRPKLWAVSSRFLTSAEALTVGQDLSKLCYYWCAKEAIYKCYGQRQVSFKAHIRLDFPENYLLHSQTAARIVAPSIGKCYELHYRFFENHGLAVVF